MTEKVAAAAGDEVRQLTTVGSPALVGSDALADVGVELYNRLTETSAAGALGVKFVETTNSLPYPVVTVNSQGVAAASVEGTALRESGNITFSRVYLGAHKTVASVPASNEMLSDTYLAGGGVEELLGLLTDAAARRVDPLVFNGTGTNQPRGFVQDLPAVTVDANPSHEQLFDVSLLLDSALYREPEYLCWGFHRDVLARIYGQGFSNSAGPVGSGTSRAFSDDKPLMLWGYPVVLCNDLATGTSNGTRIGVFGHFRRAVRLRFWKTVAVSDETPQAFGSDQTDLRVSMRIDSRVVDATAARALVVG